MSAGTIRISNNSNFGSLGTPINNRISINVGAGPSVTFNEDGDVTFHDGATVSEVAKVFWETLAHANPLREENQRLKQELAKYQTRSMALHSIDLIVLGPTNVRVEYDGSELRARTESSSWQTVRVNF